MERATNKLLRIVTVTAIVVGTVGISSRFSNSSEVSATNNTVNSAFTLHDFEEGIKISYKRLPENRYEPIFMIGFGNYEIPYHSTCNSEQDEYGDNCYYLIPEAKTWSKFTPITHELGDQSVRWTSLPDGSFVRDTGVQRTYLPIISK